MATRPWPVCWRPRGLRAFAVSDLAEALCPAPRPGCAAHPDSWLDRPCLHRCPGRKHHHQAAVSLQHAGALSYAALHAGVTLNVHLKVDTGMGRVGFAARDDMERAVAELEEACHLPNLSPTGIFTFCRGRR